VTLLEHDIRDVNTYASVLRDASVVYHLACLGVRHSVHSPIENHEVNATGTLRLLERQPRSGRSEVRLHVELRGVRHGTARAHDRRSSDVSVHRLRWVEARRRGLHAGVSSHLRRIPRSSFGRSTLTDREAIMRETAAKSFRSFSSLSRRQADDHLRRRHADARLHLRVGLRARHHPGRNIAAAIGRTINLGSGFELTINDLAKTIAEMRERPDAAIQHDEPRPGDVLRLYADMSQARCCSATKPACPLAEDLRQLLAWYRAQGTSPEELLRNEVVRNWDVRAAAR
jgi:UDP-glucose 4-epimerase